MRSPRDDCTHDTRQSSEHPNHAPFATRTRNQARDCQVERIAYEKGLISPQTWSLRLGLDYDQEQKNIAMHGKDIETALGGQN